MLGAYQAGAYQALHEDGHLWPTWLVDASTGAVTAALIAGNPPERRLERLRRFWDGVATIPVPFGPFWPEPAAHGPWRATYNRAGVLQTLLFGRPGMFRPGMFWPRLPAVAGADDAPGLYDLAPLRTQLTELVDFGRPNGGDPRVSVVMTDVATGERVVLDTGRGERIEPDHVVASGALMPPFAPAEMEGRLLGDGGFVANTPLDLVLDEPASAGTVCFAVDLFARESSRSRSLPAAAARAADLLYGSQTHQLLRARRREHRLRAALGRLAARLPPEALAGLRADPDVAAALARDGTGGTTVLRLAYRALADEAGPGKAFDFSRATLAERWRAGAADTRAALRRFEAMPARGEPGGFVAHEIGR